MDEATQSPNEPPAKGDSGEARHVGDSNPPPITFSAAELKSIRETFVTQDPESRRFSMWDLLAIVTAASLVLAAGTYVSKPVFAGTVGTSAWMPHRLGRLDVDAVAAAGACSLIAAAPPRAWLGRLLTVASVGMAVARAI